MRRDSTIVLIHGLTVVRQTENTFVGVPEALEAKGFRVRRTQVRGNGTLDALAERVWSQIEPIDGPLVLLCHSMGGLQARTFLLNDERARRIESIITVGTPHAGLPLARVAGALGQAYRDMTIAARRRWVSEHGAAEQASIRRHGVRCLSVVASLTGWAVNYRLRPTQLLIREPSDGLVPATSQRWEDVAFDVPLDHMECACVHPPSPRQDECVDLWVRMAESATVASVPIGATVH
jgi:pimeloyl-ACP methyl ester carboxylesterase